MIFVGDDGLVAVQVVHEEGHVRLERGRLVGEEGSGLTGQLALALDFSQKLTGANPGR